MRTALWIALRVGGAEVHLDVEGAFPLSFSYDAPSPVPI